MVVYPDHWDSLGYVLYPVLSWWDWLFWIGVQGWLGMDHGIGSAPSDRWQTWWTIVVVVDGFVNIDGGKLLI